MSILDVNWNPSRTHLRRFVGVWLPLFFAIVGAYVWYSTGSVAGAVFVWSPALLVAVGGLLSPLFARIVFVGWMGAVYPIGWTVSHLALAGIYYLGFVPIGVAMRLLGRDPLTRKFDIDLDTYWDKYRGSTKPARYFRQF